MPLLPSSTRLVFAAALVIAAATAAAAQGGFPALSLEPSSVEFGTMPQNTVRTQTVVLTNVGGAPLTISDVETTCGCTAAKPEKTVLQPGERTTMLITFDSQQFQGAQHKFVRVHSNDAAEPITELPVNAMVKAPLIFTPGNKMLGFGNTRAGEATPKVILVADPEGAPLEVACTRINREKLSVSIAPDKNVGPSRQVISVTLNPEVTPGEIREILSFSTSMPAMPTFDVEVSGKIVADVELYPATHNFRYVGEGQQLSRLFQVKMPRGFLKVTGAEIDLPGCEVTSVELNEATGFWDVMVEGSAVGPEHPGALKNRGRFKGVLRITTDHPDLPSLEAQVRYMIRL